MKKSLTTCVIFLLVGQLAVAQIGGNNIYEFLMLPPSARVTALGDHLITVRDADVTLAYQNPAVLNPLMHQNLSFNHSFHLADISFGYLGYGHHHQKWDMTFHGGLQYMNYGEFDATDVFGNINGTFKASEYAFTLGAGKQLYEKLSVGANVKFITSQFESYTSVGWSSDLGVSFQDTSSNFSFSLVLRNLGSPITRYTENTNLRESLPFESQIAISKKLRYLPFRFSVLYRYLNRWNILYDDPNNPENAFLIEGFDNVDTSNPGIDNFFRHFVFNGEFLFGKAEVFRLRMGYNVLRARELKVNNLRSLAGFSFGFGIKIKRFQLDYGQGVYHLGGSSNHLSLSTSLSEFKK
ncbi:MAG: type IX secretion system protein PorQ [Bacteroidota bacterium]